MKEYSRLMPGSLRARLLLLLVLVGLPLLVMLTISAAEQHRYAHQQAWNTAVYLARLLEHSNRQEVARARTLLQALSMHPDVHPQGADACTRQLAATRAMHLHLTFLGVVDARGDLTCSDPVSAPAVNLGDRAYFITAQATCQPALGRVQQGRVSLRPVISLAYPLCDPDGTLQHMLLASLPLERFADLFMQAPLPLGTQISMVDRNTRKRLLHYRGAITSPDDPIYETPLSGPAHLAVEQAADSEFTTQTEHGEWLLVIPLDMGRDPALTRLALLFEIPGAALHGEYDHLMRWQLFIVLLTVAAGILIGWSGSTRAVVEPVSRLLVTMARFARGDLDARTGPPRERGELGELCNAFDRMADRIRAQHNELLRHHAEVERLGRLYAVLSRVNSAIVRITDSSALAEEICKALEQTGAYRKAWVFRAGPEGTAVTTCGQARFALPVPTSHDMAALRTIVVDNGLGFAQDAGPCGSLAYVPVRRAEVNYGQFVVCAETPDAFGDKELALFGELAGDFAFALELSESRRRFDVLAFRDPMTGLPNRAMFEERLRDALEEAQAAAARVAVLVLKIDGLSRINAVFGRNIGDAALLHVARALQALRADGAFVARVSNSGFGVVQPLAAADARPEDLLQSVADLFPGRTLIEGEELFLSVSGGLALYPERAHSLSELLQHANAALVEATRQQSGNSFRVFEPAMATSWLRRYQFERALRRAVDHGEFTLHFQPQASLHTGTVVGFEVLLRWHAPEFGSVPPSEFIPLAESTGLITPLGAWVLDNSLRQVRAWHDAGLEPGVVAINLSARQLEPATARTVADTINASGLEPSQVELELTETAITDDPHEIFQHVRSLKEIGVRIALDDFGTGYSSLAWLKEHNFDRLKIDYSFVRNVIDQPYDAAIVRTVIAMGRSLQMDVLAEGVETLEQAVYLKRFGCDSMQGYLFSQPLSAHEAAALLRRRQQLAMPDLDEARSARTLLLVDEESLTHALRRLLQHEDLDVLTAQTASEALTTLARQPVGVVVADMRLPDMDGMVFLRHLRDMYPRVVRVLLTGYPQIDTVVEAVNQGAFFRFAVKPWDDQQLLGHIRAAFRHHHQLMEERP